MGQEGPQGCGVPRQPRCWSTAAKRAVTPCMRRMSVWPATATTVSTTGAVTTAAHDTPASRMSHA